MSRRFVLSLVLAVVTLSWLPASADGTLVAHGTVTFTVRVPGVPPATCSAASVIQFHNTGSTFVLTEATPAGQAPGTPPVCAPLAVGPYSNTPTIRHCTPIGGFVIPGSTLTVSGNTYTIRSPYTTCSGSSGTDTIVLTVGGATIPYRHDILDHEGTEIHVLGTLARIV